MATRATGHSPAKKPAAKKPAPKKPVAKAAAKKPVKKAPAPAKKPAAKPAAKAAVKKAAPAAKAPAAKPSAHQAAPPKPAAAKPAAKPAKPAKKKPAADRENQLYMQLASGRVVIDLKPDLAPGHVARIKELVRQKYYDGLVFHRVIEGFMAQTGDPRGDGTGGSGTKLKAEFSEAPHERGTVSMARAANPDSGDSQFFICFAPARFLDRQYTVWGKVSSGMQHVDQIKKGDRGQNGLVTNPDRIITLRVAADVEE
jgi:peptidylprolyl isomerase